MEPYYREGKIYHSHWMKGKELETQLLTFPKAVHDDLMDSLAMHLDVLVPGQEVSKQVEQQGTWGWWANNARRLNSPYRSFYDHG